MPQLIWISPVFSTILILFQNPIWDTTLHLVSLLHLWQLFQTFLVFHDRGSFERSTSQVFCRMPLNLSLPDFFFPMGFWEEDHKEETPFSFHHIRFMFCGHSLLLVMWAGSPGQGSVCQLSPMWSYFLLFHTLSSRNKSFNTAYTWLRGYQVPFLGEGVAT